MATLVAPRPTWPLDRADWLAGRGIKPRGNRRFGALLAAGLALFAVCVHGYHPYAEDGGLYMAGVKRLLDPALYPHGSEFVQEPMRFSVFAPVSAALVRFTPAAPAVALPWVFLLLHLGTLWLTLFAAWTLAGRLFPVRRTAQIGAVLLLACWIALPVAGTALLLMDPYLTARSFSTPCTILTLVGVWDVTGPEPGIRRSRRSRLWRGAALSIISLTFGAAMHPLMTAYGWGACLTLAAIRAWRGSWRYVALATLAAVSIGLAFAMQRIAQSESSAYVAIALTRSYWFLAQWRWYEWAGLAAPLAVLGLLSWDLGRRALGDRGLQELAGAAIITALLATLVSALFVRSTGSTHLVARLQPMRELQFPYLVMIVLLGAWLADTLLTGSRLRWAAATLLLSAPLYAASRAVYRNSPHLELPATGSGNAWAQAFLWIREHTPKDANFALNADYIQVPGEDAQCFRALAQRSALPDLSKDGGEAAIAPELTDAWVAGQAAQRDIDLRSDDGRRSVLEPQGVTWIVLSSQSATGLDCPYANALVRVCRLR